MTTANETETWRKKYFDSLRSIEQEQQEFRAMEAALKRLAQRLCAASLGQSPRLDAVIERLQNAIRRDAKSADLEQFTPSLTEAIQELDQSSSKPSVIATGVHSAFAPARAVTAPAATPATKAQAAGPRPSLAADQRVRAILAAMLAELRRDPALAAEVNALDAKLTESLTDEQFPDVLSQLTAVVEQRIRRIEQAKQEVEVLLGTMVGKLDEIGHFVAEQNQSQSESHASSETLNIRLAGEMKAMGESVEASSDLREIRSQVRHRIESIDRHLDEFRQRETALAAEMSARNDELRQRIEHLEGEASRLQNQLQDEQRQSTIDQLTQVANRLAYDQRIAEEIERWQRFAQPTCLAVWDVDHFKRINDTYGHRAGDRVLRAVATGLAKRIRTTDFVARYGGEEFVTILPGSRLEDALRVVDAMRSAIAEIGFHFRGTPVSITVSSGITQFQPGDSAGAAFDRADKALYKAKETGRNRVTSG